MNDSSCDVDELVDVPPELDVSWWPPVDDVHPAVAHTSAASTAESLTDLDDRTSCPFLDRRFRLVRAAGWIVTINFDADTERSDAHSAHGYPYRGHDKESLVDGIIGNRILRCSDGHLFTSSQSARLFTSLHLGPNRLMRCSIDRTWRVMSNVDSRDLTSEQLFEATRRS